MKLTLICPKCGKEKETTQFIDGICLECYVKEKEIIALPIKSFLFCKGCGRLYYKGNWIEFHEDDIKKIVKENIKVDLEEYEIKDVIVDFSKDNIKIKVRVKGSLDNHVIVTEKEFVVPITYQYCEDCYKALADFYKAIVQIRYDNEVLEKIKMNKETLKEEIFKKAAKIIKELRKKGEFDAFVQKVEDVKGGFDIYLGSKNAALQLLKAIRQEFEFERKESFKIVGVDKTGKPKARYTYLVRIKEKKG